MLGRSEKEKVTNDLVAGKDAGVASLETQGNLLMQNHFSDCVELRSYFR
jgi:hypothetical protein